jgi:copper resistance protein B
MNRVVLLAMLPVAWSAPAAAQPMPAPVADPHAGHDMSKMPGMATPAAADPHAGHDMAPTQPLPVADPQAPPPAVPTDHAADRAYDPAAMAAARAQLQREHGGGTYSKVTADILEYQARSGGDGYRWEGEAWFGGDINRLVVKSEGEGAIGGKVDAAEARALYSRAISPYFDLQTGLRHDFRPKQQRTYATVGVEGLAPYWFELDGALFLSSKGEVLARAGGSYDLRLTQRLILQPRAELNFAARNTPETATGSGLSDAQLDLRLRYEIRREFAPYIGVSFERRFGKTADYARALGEDVRVASFVVGVRAWF